MADPETRAGDLLDRLSDCGLGDGMNEEDVLGGAVREPLRACCLKLAARLWALCQQAGFGDAKALQRATVAVRSAADTEATAGEGRLDASLAQLAAALDPSSAAAASRLQALELATAVLQAASLAAAGVQAAGGGEEMAEAEAGEEEGAGGGSDAMDTTDQLAIELSAALRSLAALLQLEGAATAPSAAALAADVHACVAELLAQLPAGFFEPLLPPGSLSEVQLATLGEVDAALRAEYAVRRAMLIERVKVTLASFLYSPRLEQQGTKSDAAAAAEAAARGLPAEPRVAHADVFSATLADLLAILERATSGESGLHASVKGVLIGSVPDRGGRPEGRRRHADMPAWTARQVTQGGSGGRGGGRHGGGRGRGGGGGRVQGGWQGGSKGRGSKEGGGKGGKSSKGSGWGGDGKGKMQT